MVRKVVSDIRLRVSGVMVRGLALVPVPSMRSYLWRYRVEHPPSPIRSWPGDNRGTRGKVRLGELVNQ